VWGVHVEMSRGVFWARDGMVRDGMGWYGKVRDKVGWRVTAVIDVCACLIPGEKPGTVQLEQASRRAGRAGICVRVHARKFIHSGSDSDSDSDRQSSHIRVWLTRELRRAVHRGQRDRKTDGQQLHATCMPARGRAGPGAAAQA
jgi:hypothetical protein